MTLQAVEPSSCAGDWRRVPRQDLPGAWPRYRKLLLDVLDRGERAYSEADILTMLLTGRWGLMASERGLSVDAICIYEVVDFPQLRRLLLRYASGDGELMLDAAPWFMEQARTAGCHEAELYGRKGWPRRLPGWEHRGVILRKDLTK